MIQSTRVAYQGLDPRYADKICPLGGLPCSSMEGVTQRTWSFS